MYTKKNLQNLIETEVDFLKLMEEKKELFFSSNNSEIYHLSISIIERIKLTKQDILKDDCSLIKLYASLRYILETLIQTELLLIEPSYTFKVFYSIYNHQIDKTRKLIQRIEREILIMDKYEVEDNAITKNFIDAIKQKNKDLAITSHEEVRENLDDRADLEYTMFCGDFKGIGYGLVRSQLEENVLPEYKKRLQFFEKKGKEISKKIVKTEYISNLFDFRNQHTRVFDELKDKRSWEKKAIIVGLENEYDLIYDLSSAILHSTSYSYGTSLNTSKNEIDMVLNLCFKYSKKIIINLNTFTNVDFYKEAT